MQEKSSIPVDIVELRRRAEIRINKQQAHSTSPRTEADTNRFLHELQVHQIELEMQNSELQEARAKVETLLEAYTDLYDFAPVGYFSVDEQGLILEANLTGAALLGIERSRLITRRLQDFVDPPGRTIFLAFLKNIYAASGKQICQIPLLNDRSIPFWADLQATSAGSLRGTRKWCRMAISDVTTLKQAEEVRQSLEAMAALNRKLKLEIVQRHKVEEALKKSEAHDAQLFEQLRNLSHRLLLSQEAERKLISRELHDEIVQTLVGINVHLASLTAEAPVNLRKQITRTQRLVDNSVNIVHRFARELRPTMLDDLGLIPALQAFIKDFSKRTKIRIHFTAFAGVEQLNSDQRTVLYRVVQSALSNVQKHAEASKVKVSIRKLRGSISLEIHDNGKSFKVERVLYAKRYKRLGLIGSRERVEMVGGKFGVVSAPGQGTTISAVIPFNDDELKGTAKTPRKTTRMR
jgi:PAS domain S-box-containing protein